MRKVLSILMVAAAAAIGTPAMTQAAPYDQPNTTAAPGAIGAGAATGTLLGLGVAEG